jgi:hypothetical protein
MNPTRIETASQILQARGTPRTPRALNLRQIGDKVQNDENIPSDSRIIIRDLIDFAESRDTNAILARRELREKDELLNRRRSYKKGKRVALKGKHLLSRDEILQVVINIENEVKQKEDKKGRKRKIKVIISLDIGEEESIDELA